MVNEDVLDSVGPEHNINGGDLLVLAGIELIFFTVASMGLRFGFVLETGERGDVQGDGVCPPQSPLRVMEPCCPGDG